MEMQMKTTVITSTYWLEFLNLNWLQISIVEKNAKQLVLSYSMVGI